MKLLHYTLRIGHCPSSLLYADYHEPEPEAVGPLDAAMAAGLSIHKLILMGSASEIAAARPLLEAVVHGKATLVQAM